MPSRKMTNSHEYRLNGVAISINRYPNEVPCTTINCVNVFMPLDLRFAMWDKVHMQRGCRYPEAWAKRRLQCFIVMKPVVVGPRAAKLYGRTC